jgi:nucleoside phosphorylase
MSSSKFDVFYETGAVLTGEDACRAVVAYLRRRGRGQRISPARMAADLGFDMQLVLELMTVACSPAVGLLCLAPQVRCPSCDARLDHGDLLAALQVDGEVNCSECDMPIANPTALSVEARVRLADDADAEVAVHQEVEKMKPRMRVVVLCALLVELRAVHEQMQWHGEVGNEVVDGGEIYLTGVLAGRHVTWEVRVGCSERSNSAAAASLANAVNNFSPQVAVFVGIAGGIAPDVALGDVVAATTIFEYDQGKATQTGYQAREVQLHSSFNLTQAAMHVALTGGWLDRILPSGPDPQAPPAAHVEPIAAGGKVIAASDSTTVEMIKAIAPRVVAVETEGAGFLTAAHRFQTVSAIVVRGISDLLDSKHASETQGWQPRAAANAAAFAYALLDAFQTPSS